MSKQGVKRGTTAHNMYLAQKSAVEEQKGRDYWWLNRQFVLDAVVIALGDMMAEENEPEQIWDFMDKFSTAYLKVENDIAYEVAGEADEEAMNRDKVGSSWVAKERVDRLLSQYVRPEEFKPFDERYYDAPHISYTMKDSIIYSLKRVVQKKDDEITKLKGQIKLMKVKRDG